MAGAISQDRQRCQFPLLVDEKPAVLSIDSTHRATARVGRPSFTAHQKFLKGSRVIAVRILSESSRIRLAKAGKTADLQWSKPLDISSRNGKPWKVWYDRTLEAWVR